jgi:hypothetical protein
MAGNKVYPLGQCYKTFFSVTNECAKQARLFVPGRLYKPSLMFEYKTKSLPRSGAPDKCFVRVSSILTHKYYTRFQD